MDKKATQTQLGSTGNGMKPTMVDVAKLAGVSQATVSLVLNNVEGSRVNAQTQKAVRDAAEKLGYSIHRRSPVGAGAVQTIGYLIDDTVTHPMVNIAIEAAREAAWNNGCVLLVLPTQGDKRLRAAAVEVLSTHRLAGMVVASFFTRQTSLPRKLWSQPTVLVNCYTAKGTAPALLPDHTLGAERIVNHLIAAGHRRIGFLSGELWMDGFRDRMKGYRHALKAAGIPFDPELVLEGTAHIAHGQNGTRSLMALRNPPTAIFCGSDRVAIGCYEELKERGLAIPDAVSVVGFDDDPIARFLAPPLTTVVVPHAEMGRRAIEHLLAKRSHSTVGLIDGRTAIDCPLVERLSVGPPRAKRAAS